ncbi:MAG: hypothetical protein CMI18_00675 [Opitutaceae bacterium]|nr:hypothetical protein [Opitutaceae bacterium]
MQAAQNTLVYMRMEVYLKFKFACLAFLLIALGGVVSLLPSSFKGLHAESTFVSGQNEELLGTIFQEEKSNAVCRFLKSKKLKA